MHDLFLRHSYYVGLKVSIDVLLLGLAFLFVKLGVLIIHLY